MFEISTIKQKLEARRWRTNVQARAEQPSPQDERLKKPSERERLSSTDHALWLAARAQPITFCVSSKGITPFSGC